MNMDWTFKPCTDNSTLSWLTVNQFSLPHSKLDHVLGASFSNVICSTQPNFTLSYMYTVYISNLTFSINLHCCEFVIGSTKQKLLIIIIIMSTNYSKYWWSLSRLVLLFVFLLFRNADCGQIVRTLPGFSGTLPFSLETGWVPLLYLLLFFSSSDDGRTFFSSSEALN